MTLSPGRRRVGCAAAARFVTDGDPGWEPFRDHRSPVMIFGEPSEVRENPLELERTAWIP